MLICKIHGGNFKASVLMVTKFKPRCCDFHPCVNVGGDFYALQRGEKRESARDLIKIGVSKKEIYKLFPSYYTLAV